MKKNNLEGGRSERTMGFMTGEALKAAAWLGKREDQVEGEEELNNRPSPSSLLVLYSSIGLQKDHTPFWLRLLYVLIAGNSEGLWEINTSLLEAMTTSWEVLMMINKKYKIYSISKEVVIVSLQVPGGLCGAHKGRLWKGFAQRWRCFLTSALVQQAQ